MLGRAIAVAERDLRKFRRNPILVITSVVLPLLYLVIMGNSLQGDLHNLPLAFVDQDGGPGAVKVLTVLKSIEAGKRAIRVEQVRDQGQALEDLKMGRFKGVLILPEGFSAKLKRAGLPEVGLVLDNTDAISASFLSGLLHLAILEVREGEGEGTGGAHGGATGGVREVQLYRSIEYVESLTPGVVIMAIFMGTMMAGAMSIVMDKFLGVHESYFVTPLTKRDLVVGIVASGMIQSTFSATIVFIVSLIITGTRIAGGLPSLALIFLTIVLTAFGLLSMTFILVGRANHPRMVGVLSGFLNVILFFPSGAIYPVESFPGWLRAFARVNPEAYAVHAFKALLFRGASLDAIRGDLVFLSVFALLMTAIATLTFKRTLQ